MRRAEVRIMTLSRFLFAAVVLCIALARTPSTAQDETPISTNFRVDFTLVYSALGLAFDPWNDEEPPSRVRLDAYRVASGFLAGIPFHFERNRDRLSIFEQVDDATEEMEFKGHRQDILDYYFFDYTVWVPSATYDAAHKGNSVHGHGVSDLEDMAEARSEARMEALEEVVRSAIRSKYTESNELIPGTIDGRIMWYDVDTDGVDPESGSYVFDVTAWVSFDEE